MTKKQQRRAIAEASHRANRVADSLRYLDAAMGSAREAGLQLDASVQATRFLLTTQLERDAELAGFPASEFYKEEN